MSSSNKEKLNELVQLSSQNIFAKIKDLIYPTSQISVEQELFKDIGRIFNLGYDLGFLEGKIYEVNKTTEEIKELLNK